MRDLVFRAWNVKYKEWVSEQSMPVLSDTHNKIWSFGDTGNIKFMQYTGLKDKNGKMIFESDIVRIPPGDLWEQVNYISYEVFFHDNNAAPNNCVGFKIGRAVMHGNLAGGISGYNLLPKETAKLEVIGNIHENEELLK